MTAFSYYYYLLLWPDVALIIVDKRRVQGKWSKKHPDCCTAVAGGAREGTEITISTIFMIVIYINCGRGSTALGDTATLHVALFVQTYYIHDYIFGCKHHTLSSRQMTFTPIRTDNIHSGQMISTLTKNIYYDRKYLLRTHDNYSDNKYLLRTNNIYSDKKYLLFTDNTYSRQIIYTLTENICSLQTIYTPDK